MILVGILIASSSADEIKPYGPYDKLEGYFQYANVPAEGEYEFGFHRGNADHDVSRHEQYKNGNFRTKVNYF
jgi:hypothetical protein